jgi:hypothetical protein
MALSERTVSNLSEIGAPYRAHGIEVSHLSLHAQSDPMAVSSSRFKNGWITLTKILGIRPTAEIANVFGIGFFTRVGHGLKPQMNETESAAETPRKGGKYVCYDKEAPCDWLTSRPVS